LEVAYEIKSLYNSLTEKVGLSGEANADANRVFEVTGDE